MTSLIERLEEIGRLNRGVKPREAEALFLELLAELLPTDLQPHEPQLRQAIATFRPKRERVLNSALEERLRVISIPPSQTPFYASLREQLRTRLDALSEDHIFQWATFYRDAIDGVFDDFIPEIKRAPNTQECTDILREEFARHTRDIFAKGFHYLISQQTDQDVIAAKQLSGIERFLGLPVSRYLASSAVTSDTFALRCFRSVCSSILTGILQGFGETAFGEGTGWQILPRFANARKWAHCIPFILHEHLKVIVNQLEPGEFADTAQSNIVPVVEVLDRLVQDPDLSMVPVVGEYIFQNTKRRMVIVLTAPTTASGRQTIEIHCHLNYTAIDRYQLEESANRGVALIIAPLRPDLAEWVETHDLLRRLVVNTMSPLQVNAAATTAQVFEHLAGVIAASRKIGAGAIVTYNYARDFPLEKPSWKKFFFIHRPSVRSLLQSFEQTTGVHLWCSVRRSGKTTAGFDLTSTTGSSVVVSQTCDSTGERQDDDVFYKHFTSALDRGQRLPPTFFADSITACLPNARRDGDKIIFILDEYETLFGQLNLAVQGNPAARYNVVQPLLNQMVRFSRENLLVLIGMRPDAHFILMDQNQLSPCIEQDHFPLFEHSSNAATSEFRNLLKTVVSNRAEIEPAFADIVHTETGGHPFLTINLLIELFDWLIAKRWPAAPLRLSEDMFVEFATDRLSTSEIRQSNNYNVMRQFVRGALAENSRQQQPWLFAVLATLQQIGELAPQSLEVSRVQAREIIRHLGLQTSGIDDPDYLLRTGEQANFFRLEADRVRPRIPLLARIALSMSMTSNA